MDNKFDFDSKKYIILLIIICSLFAILIIKAFDYLPEEKPKEYTNVSNINRPAPIEYNQQNDVINNDKIKENTEETAKKIKSKQGVLYRSSEFDYMTEDKIPDIQAPPGSVEEEIISQEPANTYDNKSSEQLSPDEFAIKSIFKARKYYTSEDYEKSLSEYRTALDLTKDNDIKAECYDGIASIYIKAKKYGTALSFASKAYKESPTLEREFIIAKIYYLSGNTETAISRINSILKKL